MGRQKDYNLIREVCRLRYINGAYTYAALATAYGVSEKSIGEWAKNEDWSALKNQHANSAQFRIAQLNKQWDKLQEFIQEFGGFPDQKIMAVQKGLVETIAKLQEELPFDKKVQVSESILAFVRQECPEIIVQLADTISRWIVKEQAKHI